VWHCDTNTLRHISPIEVVEFWNAVTNEHHAMLASLQETRVPSMAQTERNIVNEWYHRRRNTKVRMTLEPDRSNAQEYYQELYRWNDELQAAQDAQPLASSSGAAKHLFRFLPSASFANGRLYFESAVLQANGIIPAVVHCNHVMGLVNKRDRFAHSGMWLLRQHDGICPLAPWKTPPPPLQPQASAPSNDVLPPLGGVPTSPPLQDLQPSSLEQAFKLRIIVLAQQKRALSRCLNALREAAYHLLDLPETARRKLNLANAIDAPRAHIELDIHIDAMARTPLSIADGSGIESILAMVDQYTYASRFDE
jgi:hypothetical protein